MRALSDWENRSNRRFVGLGPRVSDLTKGDLLVLFQRFGLSGA